MKIGFVRRGYSATGGAEAYLRRLAAGVGARGHAPVLIGSGHWPEKEWPGDFVVAVDGGSPERFARGAERAAEGCDVVFSLERMARCDVYRAGDGVHAAWLERRAAFEPGWRRWARRFNRKHRELLALERQVFSAERTRWVIANSAMVRDEIVARYGYPAERITVIPNGYDAPEAGPGARERRRTELGLGAEEFVVLFAGSGWERKGLWFAVEAVRGRNATLLVAGRGRWRGSKPENVRWLGPRRDLADDFAAADAFVLPTIYDPFSNACLEALAAGLPVVTTSANGCAEILTPGVHGFVVAPGDVAGLREALEFWRTRARMPGTREVCAARGREFSLDANVEATLAVIGQLPRGTGNDASG